jgi:hypothetical protein
MKTKKKLDELTQAKLVYTIELGVFVLIFLTVGLLFYFSVFKVTETRITIFTYVTMIGGFLSIGDFIWFLASKKRRKKNSFLDKVLILPIPLSLIPFDILTLAQGAFPNRAYALALSSVFTYIAVMYTVELAYHWFHPIPLLLEAGEDLKAAEVKDANKEPQSVPTIVEVSSTPTEEKKEENHDSKQG